MIATPIIPKIPGITWSGLPLKFELTPVTLGIVMTLVLIFFAVVSLVLLYHWRRFPFEHETFQRVEKVYEVVSLVLVAIAVFAVFFS